jgi:hypothetical protein
MQRKLEARVALLEQFVFNDLVKGIAILAKAQRVSDAAASATHNLQDFQMKMVLLAALKRRPLEELVHLPTRELVPILMKDLDEGTSLDAVLEAAVLRSKGGLKERFLRRGNQTASEFLFSDLQKGIRELDPEMDFESADFRTAAILLAAAFHIGPHVDRLVQFTGYPMTFVADIDRRM